MDSPLKSPPAIPPNCHGCRCRRAGVCQALDIEELGRLAAHSRRTRHDAGEALAVERDAVNGYANVVRGTVKLSRVLRDGRQQLVGLHFAPDLLGRLFSDESQLSAEAATEVELCRFPRQVLEALVVDSDGLKLRLLEQSLRELDAARDWMVTLGRKTAIERVASVLLLVASRIGCRQADGGTTVELPIGRADMADFLGLTLETVSRQMTRLRHDGVIAVQGHRIVVIHDLERLKARAG